jgi:methionyl-tRNA formyltransferase
MKIFAIFGEGSSQRALAHRIQSIAPLVHVARVQLKPKARRRLVRSMMSLTLARGLRSAWNAMLRRYDRLYPAWPDVPTSVHPSANDDRLIALVEQEKPDLVLVSGTDLLTARTLERFRTKVMNLHTGISPYIRGAPNCTNWALAIGEYDLIGNTVMWMDAGIDSGAIIATERTALDGRESLTELHNKAMDHAHDLYCRAIAMFVAGKELPSVPQSLISKGRLFLMRDWNSTAMLRAVFNHRFRYGPFEKKSGIRLVDLENGWSPDVSP